jgi:cytochrome c-type biogenesis protein CcsB
MKLIFKILPWLCAAVFGAEIIAVMVPKKDGDFHIREFARIPVLLNGRIQPFDSLARNSLLQIRSTGDVPLEEVPSWKFWHHPKKLKATEWLLEVMTRPEVADTRPVFLIHHAELLGELKLQDKGIEKSGLRYYTFKEIRPVVEEILKQASQASKVKPEVQTTYQKQVSKLYNAVLIYHRLKYTLQPEGVDNWAQELAEFQKNLGPARLAAHASQGNQSFDEEAIQRVALPLRHFEAMKQWGYAFTVPPADGRGSPSHDDWQPMGNALLESAQAEQFPAPVSLFARMASAYRAEDAPQFNQAVSEYQNWLSSKYQNEAKKGRAEFYFNDTKPFLHATIMYICALLLAGVALLTLTLSPVLSDALRRSSFFIIVVAGLLHTFGLVFRMVLEGRPPVTNLYSSAIFIGWGAMVLGIIIERFFRIAIGCIVASLSGFITLLIAHNLALGGDTMEMLRAVLDTNFWLATHVVVITLGYASTFFAGLLGVLFILVGLFTPLLKTKLSQVRAGTVPTTAKAPQPKSGDLEISKVLAKMGYGIVCFATLFSFVGTVLGGIWADQSWGRFWGWDPKENGALLIVLWNAIVLHARWGGLVRERGFMNLAVFGNIVTSFSWFGVNMLGIGLHSYGFMDAATKWLLLFVGSQLLVMGMGLLPLHLWRSFRLPAGAKGSTSKGAATEPLRA